MKGLIATVVLAAAIGGAIIVGQIGDGGSESSMRVSMTLPEARVIRPASAGTGAYTAEDTLRAISDAARIYGVSEGLLDCIVRVETGGTYSPYASGDRGASLGPAQLHERGLRPLFYSIGYVDVFAPYEAIDFLAWALTQGMGDHWSPVRLGMC